MPEITVIANCQSLVIGEALALCGHDIDVSFIDVNFLNDPATAAKVARLQVSGPDTLAVTVPLSAAFGPLETTELKALLGDRLATMTNLFFGGLHPDITYLGAMGARIPAVMGDYHSRLALFGYVTGRGKADTMALFAPQALQRAGYMDIFGESAAELRRRDEGLDLRLAEPFLAMTREVHSMFTVNHPTAPPVLHLARMILGWFGLPHTAHGPLLLPNHLVNNYVWPVHDALAEAHGLAWRTPLAFVRANQPRGRSMDLAGFVAASFGAYDMAGREQMREAVEAMDFFVPMAQALG